MDPLNKMYSFRKTRSGHLVIGLVDLALVYVFGSIAIDTASMWIYLITILLFIAACINFVKFDELKQKESAKPKRS